MADKFDTGYPPVTLPARGFDMDVLQSEMEKSLKAAPEDRMEIAGQEAVEAALGEDQVKLDYADVSAPGHAVVTILVGDEKRRTEVYVPEDANPAAQKKIDAAVAGDKVIGDGGKFVDAPAAPAVSQEG